MSSTSSSTSTTTNVHGDHMTTALKFAVIMALAFVGWLLGRLSQGHTARESPLMLAVGETIPPVTLKGDGGRSIGIRSAMEEADSSVLLIVSSTCSTCIGELASWNSWARQSPSHHITVLVYAPDSSWIGRARAMVKPVFDLRRIADRKTVDALGAHYSPTAYVVNRDAIVLSASRGIAATARLKTRLMGPVSRQP